MLRIQVAVLAVALGLSVGWLGAGEAWAQQGIVRILVLDEAGEPLPGVEVEVHFRGTPGVPAKTVKGRTNNRGYFVRVGLTPGPYILKFSKEGYQPFEYEMDLAPGDFVELPELTLRPVPVAAAAAPAVTGPGTEALGEEEKKHLAKVADTFAQAAAAAEAGDLEKAEALYKQVTGEVPQFATAHYNLGDVYRRKQDWPAAEAAFRRAMELEPDRSDALSALAAVYEASGRTADALALLKEGAPRFEQDARFQFNLGVASLNAGEVAEAEAAFERARELDPAHPEVHFYLGTLAVAQGETAAAIEHLERYVSLSGQNPQNLATARELLKVLKGSGA